MNLTKQEALQWHRRMWIWIAREIARCKCVMHVMFLKEDFCEMFNLNPTVSCFCCEYAYDNGHVKCGKCPVIWCNEKSKSCLNRNSEYIAIGKCRNWKKQAKLAYKIAMLPERESE